MEFIILNWLNVSAKDAEILGKIYFINISGLYSLPVDFNNLLCSNVGREM